MKYLIPVAVLSIALGLYAGARAYSEDHVLGTDGYYFSGSKNVPNYNFRVQIHLEKDGTDMVADYFRIYPHASVTPGYELRGFYQYDKDNHTCHVYMYDPVVAYWPETYGHELMHCIYGNFHDEQSNKRLQDILNGIG